MATSKLVIKKQYIKTNGYTPIYIQYIFKSEHKALLNTGYEVLPEHWNPQTQSVKERAEDYYGKNFSQLNSELSSYLNEFKAFIASTIDKKITPSIKYVKENFEQYLLNKKQAKKVIPDALVTIFDHIDDYSKARNQSVVTDTIKDYKSLKKHLMQFQKFRGEEISFSSFDYNFYEEFVSFLYHDTKKPNGEIGLLTNSVGKQIKNLKAFLRDRMRKGYCPEVDLSTYKTITEEVDRIYLSWQEISKIYHFDLQDYMELIPTRDLLVLGCLLGLRFSDLSRVSPAYIKDGYLRIRQKKVKKSVQIPIVNDAASILEKYNWHAPKLSMYEFNKNLKVLGKRVGFDSEFEMVHYKMNRQIIKRCKKYELLSSHVCRRSFCTNEYLDGTDIHLIMRISGHRTERAFLTYLKMDEVVAAKKIEEKWKNRACL